MDVYSLLRHVETIREGERLNTEKVVEKTEIFDEESLCFCQTNWPSKNEKFPIRRILAAHIYK